MVEHSSYEKEVDWREELLRERHPDRLNYRVDREWAASLLAKLGDLAAGGGYPEDITPQEIGKALYRVLSNAPDRDPLSGVLDGYYAAKHHRP